MSLRVKIALALAAIACAATVAVGVVGYRSTRVRLVDEIDRSIDQVALSVAARPRGDRVPPRGVFEIYEVRQLDRSGTPVRGEFTLDVPVSDAARELTRAAGGVLRETLATDTGNIRVHTYAAPAGAIQVARSLDEVDAVLDDLRRRTAVLVVVVSLAAAAVGALIAGSVAAPLRRLTRAAAEVETTGRLDVAVPVGRSRDEVGVLGGAFAGMLGALARSRAEQQRLVQDAGHELRTPLTSLRTNVSVLRRHDRLDPEMRTRILDDLDGEVTELTDLVNELVAAASGALADQPAETVALLPLVQAVAARVGRRRQREVVVLVIPDSPPAPVVVAPPAGLDRAITNLVDNACKFDTSGGSIEVTVNGGTVRVLDRGPGIPADDLPVVFERFHRAEAARTLPGSGLGLAIVREVVERHGGRVFAANRIDGGADVGFALPLADPPV